LGVLFRKGRNFIAKGSEICEANRECKNETENRNLPGWQSKKKGGGAKMAVAETRTTGTGVSGERKPKPQKNTDGCRDEKKTT